MNFNLNILNIDLIYFQRRMIFSSIRTVPSEKSTENKKCNSNEQMINLPFTIQ
jgi:hypothetical protein